MTRIRALGAFLRKHAPAVPLVHQARVAPRRQALGVDGEGQSRGLQPDGRRDLVGLGDESLFDQPVHEIARAGMRDVLDLGTDIDHGVALQHAELEIIEID